LLRLLPAAGPALRACVELMQAWLVRIWLCVHSSQLAVQWATSKPMSFKTITNAVHSLAVLCCAVLCSPPSLTPSLPSSCRYGQTPSWFVLFRSQKAAAIAASCNILPMNQDLFQVRGGGRASVGVENVRVMGEAERKEGGGLSVAGEKRDALADWQVQTCIRLAGTTHVSRVLQYCM
jgi:hypothetical protein